MIQYKAGNWLEHLQQLCKCLQKHQTLQLIWRRPQVHARQWSKSGCGRHCAPKAWNSHCHHTWQWQAAIISHGLRRLPTVVKKWTNFKVLEFVGIWFEIKLRTNFASESSAMMSVSPQQEWGTRTYHNARDFLLYHSYMSYSQWMPLCAKFEA